MHSHGMHLLSNRGGVSSRILPRSLINLQYRSNQTLADRIFSPGSFKSYSLNEKGPEKTMEWRLFFKSTPDSESFISPWHDIPLGFTDAVTNQVLYHYINEIPKGDRNKMECTPSESWNPIKQDIKKGQLRVFKYGDIPFNYGFIPRTWEDPNTSTELCDINGLAGDNDPLDVVEISEEKLQRGLVIPLKVISVLGLIDEGETDWKIIGIRADHPLAKKLNSMKDVEQHFPNAKWSHIILDWFKNYKIPDGKPENKFSYNSQYQSQELAKEIIEECHYQWANLLLGNAKNKDNKVKLDSILMKDIQHGSNKIATEGNKKDSTSVPKKKLPKIAYPEHANWSVDIYKKGVLSLTL